MSNDFDDIIVREATEEDALAIFNLVKQLCVFEGEKPEDAISITLSEFLEDGFGCNPSFGCIVAEDTSEKVTDERCRLVGHAIFSKSYSAWKGKSLYLDDFFIKQSYRGRGLGKRMMKKLAEVALENECKLVFFCCSRENTRAQHLYEAVGSTCIDRWAVRYWEVPEMKSFVDVE